MATGEESPSTKLSECKQVPQGHWESLEIDKNQITMKCKLVKGRLQIAGAVHERLFRNIPSAAHLFCVQANSSFPNAKQCECICLQAVFLVA